MNNLIDYINEVKFGANKKDTNDKLKDKDICNTVKSLVKNKILHDMGNLKTLFSMPPIKISTSGGIYLEVWPDLIRIIHRSDKKEYRNISEINKKIETFINNLKFDFEQGIVSILICCQSKYINKIKDILQNKATGVYRLYGKIESDYCRPSIYVNNEKELYDILNSFKKLV